MVWRLGFRGGESLDPRPPTAASWLTRNLTFGYQALETRKNRLFKSLHPSPTRRFSGRQSSVPAKVFPWSSTPKALANILDHGNNWKAPSASSLARSALQGTDTYELRQADDNYGCTLSPLRAANQDCCDLLFGYHRSILFHPAGSRGLANVGRNLSKP